MKHFSIIFALVVFVAASIFTNSFAQSSWTKRPTSVLPPGPAGDWDAGIVAFPSVLFDGSTYHMWYGEYDILTNAARRIGYATSTDGITWIKYDDSTTTNPPFAFSDPVLNPGSSGTYDDEGVSSPCVLLIDNTYHMWYGGADDPVHTSICHAISADGIIWTKDSLNNPVLDVGDPGEWDDVWLWAPSVVFDGSIYHMWYCAGDGNIVRIGHATALHPDSTWSKDRFNNPVLNIGSSSEWDFPRLDAPCVVFDGSKFHMLYSGGVWLAWRIGHATSPDGSFWTKDTLNNPVLNWGAAGTWDDSNVSHCSVLLDPAVDSLKMWYTGASIGAPATTGEIGYATAPVVGIKVLDVNLPNDYFLYQNYPNPFNPTTNIEFAIPKSEFVTLKVHNILGEEVATLVSERLTAGKYKYDWNSTDLASGVYLYRIHAGEFQEVKKMVLLR